MKNFTNNLFGCIFAKMLLPLLLLLQVFPAKADTSETMKFKLYYLSFDGMGESVCSDINTVVMGFWNRMDLQKDAVAEIWLDGKLLVKSDNIKLFQSWDFNMEETKVTITFDSPAKLEKGRKYKFLLPAGTFCSHDNPEIKSDVYSRDIELTNWLSCKDSQLFDGCALPYLQAGGFVFGAMDKDLEKVNNPKASLYKGNELMAEAKINLLTQPILSAPMSEPYINFLFDKRIDFEQGGVYTLVVPEGSVRVKSRKDVVNKEIRINITGTQYVPPVLGKENPSGLKPDFFALSSMYIYGTADCFVGDLIRPYMIFGDLDISGGCPRLEVKDGAKAYVMCGNEVVATTAALSSEYLRGTTIHALFYSPVRLPKGKSYQLVIPEGSIYGYDDPTVTVGKISLPFVVPDGFDAASSIYTGVYEGCTLSSIKKGCFHFPDVEVCSLLNEKKVYLYKGDELVATARGTLQGDMGGVVLDFIFTHDIKLEDNAHYQLVLPAGTVRSTFREDIVNRELRLNIYGPNSSTSVADLHTVATATVSCRNGVLSVSGAGHDALVEVFNTNGTMVQRCVAEDGSVRTTLPSKGCYVVSVGGKKSKILNW